MVGRKKQDFSESKIVFHILLSTLDNPMSVREIARFLKINQGTMSRPLKRVDFLFEKIVNTPTRYKFKTDYQKLKKIFVRLNKRWFKKNYLSSKKFDVDLYASLVCARDELVGSNKLNFCVDNFVYYFLVKTNFAGVGKKGKGVE